MEAEIIKYIIIGAVIVIIINFLLNIYNIIFDYFEGKYKELKLRMRAIKYLQDKKREEAKKVIYKFYGLFEFEFEEGKDDIELKKEYCTAIEEKIKIKYKHKGLQINATDKIFFNFSHFASFEFIVDDFLKLFYFYADINKKRNIITKLKFSFYTNYGFVDSKHAYQVLTELNGMNFANQILANEKIYNEVKKQGIKFFDFTPCGLLKLNTGDEDFELYKVIKKSLTKNR